MRAQLLRIRLRRTERLSLTDRRFILMSGLLGGELSRGLRMLRHRRLDDDVGKHLAGRLGRFLLLWKLVLWLPILVLRRLVFRLGLVGRQSLLCLRRRLRGGNMPIRLVALRSRLRRHRHRRLLPCLAL